MDVRLPSTPVVFGFAQAYGVGSFVSHNVSCRECMCVILHAECHMRSIVNGVETAYSLREGMVGVVPPDRARHTVVVRTEKPTAAFLLLFPAAHVRRLLPAERLGADGAGGDSMAFFHQAMHELLCRIRDAFALGGEGTSECDAAVRRLLHHVACRCGGRPPAWVAETTGFDDATIKYVRDAIDADLRCPPKSEDLGLRTGYSPSHFARKMRLTTGLSLERFCNHRRVAAALRRLKADDVSLATLALDLGFASQSHFSRVFAACTGMTPAKFRKRFRDTASR